EPQPHNQTAASPHAVVPAGGRHLISGTHQTRPPPARPNACAVTRTGARSCPATTANRQRDKQRLNLRAVLPATTANRQRDKQRLNLRAVLPSHDRQPPA